MATDGLLTRLILSKYPDYDVNRYHFKSGDIVKLDCGAIFIVSTSAIEFVDGYIHKRSLKYREFGEVRIDYKDLPYFPKGAFVPAKASVQKSLKWSVGDVVRDPRTNMLLYLYSNQGHQRFYGYVLETDNPYYNNTRVYIDNPYSDYILQERSVIS